MNGKLEFLMQCEVPFQYISIYFNLYQSFLKNIQFYTVLNNIGDNCFVTQKKVQKHTNQKYFQNYRIKVSVKVSLGQGSE